MERREHEVAGLGRGQRDLDRLAVAHLADEDDFRRLTQRRRSAAANVGVSLCSSRWWTVPFLWLCRNSIGSSIVRMCSARVSLIRSMIAASVDDLPDPVGPGHQHDAVLQRRHLRQDRRQLQLGERRESSRDHPHDDGERAALPEDVDPEPATLGSE